tara:strand:+ start:422 stop:697 length:276 start_codon:yes stop_codon:yes gene_type:complete
MGHEVSKTFPIGDKWYNASSINPITKKEMPEQEVRKRVVDGELRPHGSFKTRDEAIKAAKRRSKSFDNKSSKTLQKKYNNTTRKATYSSDR